jgi:hypothetical protein
MRRELIVNACVCVLNIPWYIFIVWRLSILSKMYSNNPYRIRAEHYLPNQNYLIIQIHGRFDPPDARAGVDSQVDRIYLLGLSCSWPTFWFGQVMTITHAPWFQQ